MDVENEYAECIRTISEEDMFVFEFAKEIHSYVFFVLQMIM